MLAPPASRTYVIPSGGTMRVGQTAGGGGQPGAGGSVDLMTIRPAPGYLKSIHANSLSSVSAPQGAWYTWSSGQNGPWSNWCGSVFASDYSQHGAEVYFGGGHFGYDGTEFYIFDLTTQLWSRLNDPISTDFRHLLTNDWDDLGASGGYVQPASHTYSHVTYIPAAAGGGTKGSWCLMFIVYAEPADNGDVLPGYKPHAVDLATGAWSRLTDNTANPSEYAYGAYGGCFTDTIHNVMWGFAGTESGTVAKIDLTANPRHITLQNIAGGGSYTYAVPVFVPEIVQTVQVSIYGDGQNRITLNMYDLASGTPVVYVPTFAAPISTPTGRAGLGVDYCPDTEKFYCYEGLGTNVLYVATPPAGGVANWKTGIWTWGTETMLGETPVSVLEPQPGAQGAQPFTKWKYYRSVKCFGFSGGLASRASPDGVLRDGAYQLYRPLGT